MSKSRLQLWHPYRKAKLNLQNFLAKTRKSSWKEFFSSKTTIFPQEHPPAMWISILTALHKKIFLNFHFLPQLRETFVHVFFLPECMFFFEDFFSTTRMQLWQPSQKERKLPNDRRYLSRSPHKFWKLNVFRKKIPRRSFTGLVECSFNKPAPTFPARQPIKLGSNPTKF